VTGYVDLENAYTPGRYWIGFWKEFEEFPSTLNTIEFSDEAPEKGVRHLGVLRSRDKDGKFIKLDISIQYKLDPDKIGLLYKDMLLFYEDIFISELRDQLAKAANGFVISEAWEKFTRVVDLMKQKCDVVLKSRHAQCWGLQLWGVSLSNQYESKLIETQVRKQAAKTETLRLQQEEVRAQTQVILANLSRHILIVKTKGEAQAYLMRETATAKAHKKSTNTQATALELVRNRVCQNTAKVVSESRYAKDGVGYTKTEFSEVFGWLYGQAEWDKAQAIQFRYAADGLAYSFQNFVDMNLTAVTTDNQTIKSYSGPVQAWANAQVALEKRYAKDGTLYSKQQFFQHFGGLHGTDFFDDQDHNATGVMNVTCSTTAPGAMNGPQLVEYQKQVLLEDLSKSHFVYKVQSGKGGKRPDLIDIESSRKIMNGQARRLLLHESRSRSQGLEELPMVSNEL
jgi:hypothetical protein